MTLKDPANEHDGKPPSAFRDRHVTARENDPYEELIKFGVTYDSTMAEIHHSGMAAQRQKALTPARRKAWGALRNAERRLVGDLLYFQAEPSPFSADEEPNERPAARGTISTADLWPLLAACRPDSSPQSRPLPPPESFLEEES